MTLGHWLTTILPSFFYENISYVVTFDVLGGKVFYADGEDSQEEVLPLRHLQWEVFNSKVQNFLPLIGKIVFCLKFTQHL
jgi:hypothetical protein